MIDPDGDEGRSLLRRELAKPEYHQDDIIERITRWLMRRLNGAVNFTQDASALSTFVAILVAIALIVAIGLLLSRARRTAQRKTERGAALTDEQITADQLRARAEAALDAGDHVGAIVDGFRALALRQIERAAIDDVPQATAHELAANLGRIFTTRAADIAAAADLFDEVLYGDRPATADQARTVLSLDKQLQTVRA